MPQLLAALQQGHFAMQQVRGLKATLGGGLLAVHADGTCGQEVARLALA